MKRYVAKALQGAAERAGVSVKSMRRKFARLSQEERAAYASATARREGLKDATPQG